ncbi:MAG: response regulator [Campylobacterota bacterium]|nr:response regulator [Campylobacterota bacterium]
MNKNEYEYETKNITLLYVEDNIEVRESTLELLALYYKNIVSAVDGQDGVHKFKNNKIDIVITDINMPNKNGLEMIEEIRKIDIDIPIIVTSAYSETEYLMQSIKLNVYGYIFKPVDTEQFSMINNKVIKEINNNHKNKNQLLLLEQYQDIVDNSTIISKTDKKGIITYVNDKFCSTSGYDYEELIGQNHNILRHPEVSAFIFEDMWKTIKNKQIWSGDIKNKAKDGSDYYVTATIKPILDFNGDIVEYIAIRKDITEIVQAKQSAEKSEKAQADFLANISHEVRTPLNGILGFSDLLSQTQPNEIQTKYIDIIHNSANMLLNIVNDVLDFSKLNNNAVKLESIKINSDTTLGITYELLKSLADKKSIHYIKDFDKKMAMHFLTDPTKLRQIITNLISNAIKFTPDNGEVIFKTEVLEDSKNKQKLRISIKDSGIGIAKDKQKLIFSAYEQASDSTAREFGGTGLGLNISKKFVEAFGGELKVDSKEGVGSTFYFDIELNSCTDADIKSMTIKDIEKKENKTITDAKLNILVVEDYDVNRMLIESLLSNYNITPTFAFDGIEAVEKVKNHTFDLILMDINMPNMDGIEAATIIRQDLKSDINIIALTAHRRKSDKEKFKKIGMNDILIKPFNQKQLHDILLKYTNKPKVNQTNEDEGEKLNFELIFGNLKKHFKGMNDKIILKLLKSFISGTEKSLKELEEFINTKDLKNIRDTAHKIAGSSGNMRFMQIYDLSKKIETDASNEIDRDYQEDFKMIKNYFEKLEKVIE